jgi:hypothetical protein
MGDYLMWFLFEQWFNKWGDYIVHKTMKDALEEAYIAGFDACRDKWGGLTYEQTIEDEKQ